jgi:hypothetical protein
MIRYQLALSNFLTALGAGLLLSISILNSPLGYATDSILGLLIGSLISLAFAVFYPHQIEKIGRFSTLGTLFSTLVLYFIFAQIIVTPVNFWVRVIIFVLICMHFSFVLTSRSIRSTSASENIRTLALVELAYSLGFLLPAALSGYVGTLTWQEAILSSSFIYGLAAIIDVSLVFSMPKNEEKSNSREGVAEIEYCFGTISLLVGLTISVQVFSQLLSKFCKSPLPLAAFDLGTTIAPLFLTVFSVSIVGIGNRSLWSRIQLGRSTSISLFALAATINILMIGVATLFTYLPGSTHSLVLLLVTSFFYEYCALLLFRLLGKKPSTRRSIPTTFATMAVCSAIIYIAFISFEMRTTHLLLAQAIAASFILAGLAQKQTMVESVP